MAKIIDDAERQREVEQYEAFEARHRALTEPQVPADPMKVIAFWVRWCGLCLSLIVLYSAAKEVVSFLAFMRMFGGR